MIREARFVMIVFSSSWLWLGGLGCSTATVHDYNVLLSFLAHELLIAIKVCNA